MSKLEKIILDNYINELWFKFRYDVLKKYNFKKGDKKTYIGNKESRTCRYCGATDKKKFKMEAHAFPELMGNHYLIDYEECDECNNKFAVNIENHFGKWTAPWRTMERIDGKNGIPAYQSYNRETEVRAANSRNISIFTKSIDQLIIDDERGRRIKLNLDRQPYIPSAVYKCLIKMAFVMIPEKFTWEKSVLRGYLADWKNEFDLTKPVQILHRFAPGPLPNDRFSAYLIKAKNDVKESIPYMQFILQMGNHSFQIVVLPFGSIPNKSETSFAYQNRYFNCMHVSNKHEEIFGNIKNDVLDMTSKSQVKGDTLTLSFNCGTVKPMPKLIGEDISKIKKTLQSIINTSN